MDGSHPDGARRDPDDDLAGLITRALRSREDPQPDADAVAARIEARLAAGDAPSALMTVTRRGSRLVVAGVVTSTLAIAGAGAAAAANPYSDVARAVENVAQAVGIEWSAMPDGYTREQYEAFWGAGYTVEDMDALSALWNLDATSTKARAGQLLIDGQTPPVTAGSVPVEDPVDDGGPPGVEYTTEQSEALWGAGYTDADVNALVDLWDLEYVETKARAGQMILDGDPLPVAPGETVEDVTIDD
jgi:hypothetical protein